MTDLITRRREAKEGSADLDVRVAVWAGAIKIRAEKDYWSVWECDRLWACAGRHIDASDAEVARPSIFGNPFSVLPNHEPGKQFGRIAVLAGMEAFGGTVAVPTVEDAVECFRELMAMQGERPAAIRERLPILRGKNLACFCKLDEPCHADVLLELANRPICEPVE